jgi:3-oxoacyl-[acyl-carrier protein] reductase
MTQKVAIVTGASRGVGASIAKLLAEQGVSVCVNFNLQKDKAESVVQEIQSKGGKAFAFQADVTNLSQVEKMVEATLQNFGRLDFVINNALPKYEFNPSANYVNIETVNWSDFEGQFNGVIQGVVNTTKASLEQMKKQKFGKIINISTNLVYNPVVTYYDYTTAKSALIGLTRSLAVELGKFGIRVNLIAGGLLSVTDASSSTTKEVFDYIANVTPLRMVTTVEDFAKSVLLFTSPWSDSITGQSVSVDGGLTMP